jgi:hypothetical protein
MKKKVKAGDKLLVNVTLSFDGTIRNHIILVEDQHEPTTNNKAVNYPIIMDGNPVQVLARFIGVAGSVVKSFTLEINGKKKEVISNIKMKRNEMEVRRPLDYSEFNLEEIQ